MRPLAEPPPQLPAATAVARGLLVPFLAGAVSVLGFAPFYAWPLPVLGVAILFRIWARSPSIAGAALSGFAFGIGLFLAGISWIYVSLHRYGGMPAPLAALATFLLSAYCALFYAAGGWAALRIGGADAAKRLIAMPAALVALEWIRSWLFTGFPWLTLGTSQVPSGPLAGYAPLLGVYGTSLALTAAAALLAAITLAGAKRERWWLAAGALLVFAVGGISGLVAWTEPAGPPITVALLQGNVAQALKWNEDMRTRILADYRRMIFDARADLVVLPETALPAYFDQLPADYLEEIRERIDRDHKEVLLGTVERDFHGGTFDYYNSLVNLTGTTDRSYRKRHLVPFGEYIPPGFKWALAILHIPMSDFSRGATRPRPILASGIPLGVAICYEDIFGEEVIDFLPEAQALVNVSNDAWFGDSFAADQHLQASQMRALETGRWMVRSTNTGVSAAVDPQGQVMARLPAFTAGTLTQAIIPRKGATPYVVGGNLPALLMVLALLAAAHLARAGALTPPGSGRRTAPRTAR